MKRLLVALALLAAMFTIAAWALGRQVGVLMDEELARLKTVLPHVVVVESQQTQGVFGSTRTTVLQLSLPGAGEACDAPGDAPPGMAGPAVLPQRLTLQQAINHGPMPGWGWPAAARVRNRLQLEPKAEGEGPGIALGGALPTVTTRYGFGGRRLTRIEGAAMQLGLTTADGQTQWSLGWPGIDASGRSSDDGQSLFYRLTLPALDIGIAARDGEAIKLHLEALSANADHRRPDTAATAGSDTLKLGSLRIERGEATVLAVQGLQGKSQSQLDQGLLSSSTQWSAASLSFGSNTLGPVHLDTSLLRLEAKAFGALMQGFIDAPAERCAPRESAAARMQALRPKLPALLAAAPEFRIDRLSAVYQGQEARLSGSLGLPLASDPAQSERDPLARLDLRLSLALPESLLQTLLAHAIQRREGNVEPGPGAALEERAKALAAEQVEQALARRWIVRGEGGITATLSYREGALLLNGQPPRASEPAAPR